MPPRDQSIEERTIKVSIRVVVAIAVFILLTGGAGIWSTAAWAANVSNHLANQDKSLEQINESLSQIKDLNLLRDHADRMEQRILRLEEWRLGVPSR